MIVLAALVALAWTGSNPTVEIVSPSGIGDSDVLAEPVRLVVKQINTAQGVDYGTYWLVEDTDADSIIDAGEWAAAVVVPGLVEDVNRETAFAIAWLRAPAVKQGMRYFIVGCLRDLDGNVSCDTSKIVGETCKGGGASGIADKAVARFKVEGYRP